MTTLAAWASVDQRRISACYLISDSRISWSTGCGWNAGQKLFVSNRYADIFGFCGDVQFPTLALRRVIDLLDSGCLFPEETPASERNQVIAEQLRIAYQDYPAHVEQPSSILHMARDGVGGQAEYYLWRLDWSRSSSIVSTHLDLPTASVLGVTRGSGCRVLENRNEDWKRAQGRTSRGIFSSFCDSIASGEDPRTGGAPQLVGLRPHGSGRLFGIVIGQVRYLAGGVVPEAAELDKFEWFNHLFERTDPRTLERLPGAQRQPKPKGVK